jgi:hypothetical protein
MTIAQLAPSYRGRVVVPVLGKVQVTGCTDRVSVRLVSGQSPANFADPNERPDCSGIAPKGPLHPATRAPAARASAEPPTRYRRI